MNKTWSNLENHYKNLGIDPKRICKDGIINPNKFYDLKTTPKILFILRDQNNPKGGSDLRDLFKEGPKYLMGHTLARWATGILNKFPAYEQIENDHCLLKESLTKTAVINLKKTGGSSQAIAPVINAYAHQDKDLLLEQINSIGPTMIIACGTIDSLIWLLDLKTNSDNPFDNPIKDKTKNWWVIPWNHHPSAPGNNFVKRKKIYQELKCIIDKVNQ